MERTFQMTNQEKQVEDKLVKKYLKETPLDERLPEKWEVRFGLRGRFMKYDSIEHCERKNMHNGVPFGYAKKEWQEMKSNIQEGDELWIYGNESTIIYLIRNGEIAYDWTTNGKYKYPRRGFHIITGFV